MRTCPKCQGTGALVATCKTTFLDFGFRCPCFSRSLALPVWNAGLSSQYSLEPIYGAKREAQQDKPKPESKPEPKMSYVQATSPDYFDSSGLDDDCPF